MDVDRCVCCGEIIPEGRMICWQCENSLYDEQIVNYDDNDLTEK